jgi:hypothetical protein
VRSSDTSDTARKSAPRKMAPRRLMPVRSAEAEPSSVIPYLRRKSVAATVNKVGDKPGIIRAVLCDNVFVEPVEIVGLTTLS